MRYDKEEQQQRSANVWRKPHSPDILKEMAELFGTILSFCWGKEDNNGHLETYRFEICPKNHQPQG